MISICDSLLLSMIIYVVKSTTFYQNDYEPRVFDYIPLNCYDCLSYRDIILTQLTTIPARSFANFNLGSRDTNMILNGQLQLSFQPYAFESLIVQKPNRTLTLTFAAPNSWLNITENTFNGLELQPYSTVRIIIKFFYGCTFHKNSLSGIKMGQYSRLIIDISSVTQIIFQNNVMEFNDLTSSLDFIISRTDAILFDSYSFSSLKINAHQNLSFYFELVSQIHLKSYSFKSLQLQMFSSFQFHSLFLTRLSIDSYAFQNLSLNTNATFNFTLENIGTCLCLKSYVFDSLHRMFESRNVKILLKFISLRGLSFLSHVFSNLTLNHTDNQLIIHVENPANDPIPIINFDEHSFTTMNSTGAVIINVSSSTIVKFEKNSLQSHSLFYRIYLKDISLVDLSLLNFTSMTTNIVFHFDYVYFVKWFFQSLEQNSITRIQLNFDQISNNSCLIYEAPRSISWLFLNANTTLCHCPLLFAYKHGQLDGQLISCLRSMSGYETARQMNECNFDRKQQTCHSTLESLIDSKNNTIMNSIVLNTLGIDNFLIQQSYDKNYLSCTYNHSSFRSSFVIRSRLFNNVGIIIGIILGIFIILLVLVMALLNGLQYKIREYDETWTWRRNMSWTSLRRTLSQTSLRRSRRDLRIANGNVTTSKSENQLDHLRFEPIENDDEQEFDRDCTETPCTNSSMQENLTKKT